MLWGDGRPVIVDPGSAAYTGPLRDRFRATLAHNTVEVDGESQCILWGDFRLGRLPNVRAALPRKHPGGIVTVAARHDGYRPVGHQRQFVWWPGSGAVVVDRLQAHAAHRVRSRLHLAAEDTAPFVARSLAGTAATVDDLYSPHLGVTRAARSLELSATMKPGEIFGWSLLRDGNDVVSTTPSELTLSGRDGELTVPLDWI